jgi:hypothetical protein
MSLPACQERILAGIETALRTGEPRLASRFAIFTRLTGDEELPSTEQLGPRPRLVSRWRQAAGTACRVLVDRPRASGTRRRAARRPAARLRALVLVPLMLIAVVTALVAAGLSSDRTCRPGPAQATPAMSRLGACAASGAAHVNRITRHPMGTSPAPTASPATR